MKNINRRVKLKSLFGVLSAFVVSLSPVNMAAAQSSGNIDQVSTGSTTACATVDGWVKCWGANNFGQVGNGKTASAQSTPVKVADNANDIAAGPNVCTFLFIVCLAYAPSSPAVPASAMAGKSVSKVSVGKSHACALANSKVYCWGDNSHGQLGDRTTSNSSVPVAVDVTTSDYTPPPVTKTCYIFIFPYKCTQTFPTQPKSSLGGKQVVDIMAGDYFSCALTNKGKVACWGEGDNGRLGNNSTSDYSYPVSVTSDLELRGQWVVKLGKISGATACALAVESTTEPDTTEGQPFCWGYGMGGGGVPEVGTVNTIACSKSSPTSKPNNHFKNVYSDATTPVEVPTDIMFSDVDNHFFATGIATNNQAYYWGGLGYREDISYSGVKSCSIRTCTGFLDGANATLASYSTAGTRTKTTKNGSVTSHYQGTAKPNTTAGGSTSGHGGGGSSSSCRNVTHYGFTENHEYSAIGNLTPKSPPASVLTNSAINSISGDIHEGLVCVNNDSGTYCDAQGTSVNEGQTGSNYKQSCTTTAYLIFFTQTTCAPPPTGPQTVVSDGWLQGKNIDELSTGASGYTCALAGGELGCWGLNSSGQLGAGDTVNKNVPTAVKF